jgi:hypothetical protein
MAQIRILPQLFSSSKVTRLLYDSFLLPPWPKLPPPA